MFKNTIMQFNISKSHLKVEVQVNIIVNFLSYYFINLLIFSFKIITIVLEYFMIYLITQYIS